MITEELCQEVCQEIVAESAEMGSPPPEAGGPDVWTDASIWDDADQWND